jgi:hypothetical protein
LEDEDSELFRLWWGLFRAAAENGEIHYGYKHLETPSGDELDRQAMMLRNEPQKDGDPS